MQRKVHFLFLIGLVLCARNTNSVASTLSNIKKSDLLSWPRSNVAQFGCFLEKSFGHRDERFNCSLKEYVNSGDPLKNTVAYYEGPIFPKDKASAVNSLIESIDLSWEHGELQAVNVDFKRKMTEKEVIAAFKLPKRYNYPRKNVMSYSIQQCRQEATCLVIQGFEVAPKIPCPTVYKPKETMKYAGHGNYQSGNQLS